jgi:hypothetical protein
LDGLLLFREVLLLSLIARLATQNVSASETGAEARTSPTVNSGAFQAFCPAITRRNGQQHDDERDAYFSTDDSKLGANNRSRHDLFQAGCWSGHRLQIITRIYNRQ